MASKKNYYYLNIGINTVINAQNIIYLFSLKKINFVFFFKLINYYCYIKYNKFDYLKFMSEIKYSAIYFQRVLFLSQSKKSDRN